MTLLFRTPTHTHICAMDCTKSDPPAVRDNTGEVLSAFVRQRSLFITENEKGATKRNKTSQQLIKSRLAEICDFIRRNNNNNPLCN